MPSESLTCIEAGEQITRDELAWPTSTITYGFRSEAPGYNSASHNQQGTWFALSATQEAEISTILQLWADLANITFSYDPDGDIHISNYDSENDGHMAFAYYPTSTGEQAGDVWFNDYYFSSSNIPEGYKALTMIHEIGHALGLQHPGDYDAGDGSFSYSEDALYIEDTRQYTVMSYFSAASTGAYHAQSYAVTPLLHDIAAIQRLYGANTNTRTGNDTYVFTGDTVQAIWDAGGIDTFDCSSYAEDQFITLEAGLFSEIGNLTANVAIAEGVTIENALGGSGHDVINGNAAANTLSGNGGNDELFGGPGSDLFYGNAGADHYVFLSTTETAVGSGDHINAFSTATTGEKIDLSAIDANVNAAGDQAFTYIGNAAFSGTVRELRYTQGNGKVSGDVNGDGIADFEIWLDNAPANANMSATEFIL